MDDDEPSYSLNFPAFSLEIEVDIPLSVADTIGYSIGAPSDFSFARATTWLVNDRSRLLLSSPLYNGNMIETLLAWEAKLRCVSLQAPVHVKPGSWGSWMRGYWQRLIENRAVADDESLYQIMSSKMILEGEGGRLAVYGVKEEIIFEASLPSQAGAAPPFFDYHAVVDRVVLEGQIQRVRRNISLAVRKHVQESMLN